MTIYEPIRSYWDKVFAKTPPGDSSAPIPVAEIEAGLVWLCAGGGGLLDFGCGHGRFRVEQRVEVQQPPGRIFAIKPQSP